MPRNTRPLRYTQPIEEQNPDPIRNRRYYYQNFKVGDPVLPYTQTGSGTAVLVVAGANCFALNSTTKLALSGSPVTWDYYATTAQTNGVLPTVGTGLEISGDELDNESLELVPGQNNTSNPLARTIGTDPGFFIRAKFKLTDASGLDAFGVGWRKQQTFAVFVPYSAADPIYTDFAMIGFAGASANPNTVRITTDLNHSGAATGATVTSTGFTWADTKAHKLEIRVTGGGQVSYLINDVPLGGSISKDADGGSITAQNTSSGAAFTFDSTDVLIPFIFLRHDTDVAEDTYLQELEIGSLVDIGLDPTQK